MARTSVVEDAHRRCVANTKRMQASVVEDAHRGCAANTRTLANESVVEDAHKFIVRLTPRHGQGLCG